MTDAVAVAAGRLFFTMVWGQDADLYGRTEAERAAAAVRALGERDRSALAAWLEGVLTQPEPEVAHALRHDLQSETSPSRWTDPDDPTAHGARAMARYALAALQRGDAAAQDAASRGPQD